MRNMSFSMTTRQYRDGTKDISRRLGWANLKVGEIVMAIEKGQGLKKGGTVVKLGPFKVLDVRCERLDWIEADDVRREGFPSMTPRAFVKMFCATNKCEPTRTITRIVFRKLPWPEGV